MYIICRTFAIARCFVFWFRRIWCRTSVTAVLLVHVVLFFFCRTSVFAIFIVWGYFAGCCFLSFCLRVWSPVSFYWIFDAWLILRIPIAPPPPIPLGPPCRKEKELVNKLCLCFSGLGHNSKTTTKQNEFPIYTQRVERPVLKSSFVSFAAPKHNVAIRFQQAFSPPPKAIVKPHHFWTPN